MAKQDGQVRFGKCGRLAFRFLKERQYSQDGSRAVDDHQTRELIMLAYVTAHAPARSIHILQGSRRPLLVYSDASYEDGQTVWVGRFR